MWNDSEMASPPLKPPTKGGPMTEGSVSRSLRRGAVLAQTGTKTHLDSYPPFTWAGKKIGQFFTKSISMQVVTFLRSSGNSQQASCRCVCH